MTFSVGDETIKAPAGTFVFAPRDIPHPFTIDSEQMRILVMCAPAGAEGFFKACSVPAPSMTLRHWRTGSRQADELASREDSTPA